MSATTSDRQAAPGTTATRSRRLMPARSLPAGMATLCCGSFAALRESY